MEIQTRLDMYKLCRSGGMGIEIGTAAGYFSNVLLTKSELKMLYSVDAWSSGSHTDNEYIEAVKLLARHGLRSVILRMWFENALHLFPDEYFDFIYIDGYAHTGQDGGKHFNDWWPKLKNGGVFSGHDYDDRWALTKKQVDLFCEKMNKSPIVVNGHQSEEYSDQFHSWYVIK